MLQDQRVLREAILVLQRVYGETAAADFQDASALCRRVAGCVAVPIGQAAQKIADFVVVDVSFLEQILRVITFLAGRDF